MGFLKLLFGIIFGVPIHQGWLHCRNAALENGHSFNPETDHLNINQKGVSDLETNINQKGVWGWFDPAPARKFGLICVEDEELFNSVFQVCLYLGGFQKERKKRGENKVMLCASEAGSEKHKTQRQDEVHLLCSCSDLMWCEILLNRGGGGWAHLFRMQVWVANFFSANMA